MIEKKVEESTACNVFMKNATAVILEYVLEVGIDKAVKDCVKDSEIVHFFPILNPTQRNTDLCDPPDMVSDC